ncbi:hypothetical protein U0070_023305 [Myodes glareolus]|uniref:Large ribosomal subunit protein eL36 n=1 Tax=Myodes glareolus TaxID=447135 RepID=A0AAW0H761_MYOGA
MHSQQYWHLTKHTKFMQDMIQKVCSFMTYNWYTMELLKVFKDNNWEPDTGLECGSVGVKGDNPNS